MKFGQLYRDVISNTPSGVPDMVSSRKIVKSINQAYMSIRDQYIKSGMAESFGREQTVYTYNQHRKYSFLNYGTVKYPVCMSMPLSQTIVSSDIEIVSDDIKDKQQSFSKGDLAKKSDEVYKAVNSFSGINTYDLTFKTEDVKEFDLANGIKYHEGNVVPYDGKYYRANTDVKATDDTTPLDSQSEWDQVYWRYQHPAHRQAEVVQFDNIQQIKILIDENEPVISVVGRRIYMSKNISRIHLIYIPEHQEVEDFDDDILVPDSAIPAIKSKALNLMYQGLSTRESNTDELPTATEANEGDSD